MAKQVHGGNPGEIMVARVGDVKARTFAARPAIALQCTRRSRRVLQLVAETREAAEACEQGRETRRVLLGHGCEFQPQPIARLNVPDDCFRPDLAFLDEKIEPGLGSKRLRIRGGNK